MTYRRVQLEWLEGICIVSLVDSLLLDRSLISELCEDLLLLIDEYRPTKLLLCFDVVIRSCKEIITILLRVRKNLAEYGGEMALCEMCAEVREVFRILRLDDAMFKIYSSRPVALSAIA